MKICKVTILYAVLGIIAFCGLILALAIKREKFSSWTEQKRGNMPFEKYPPCYDICGATRTIQDNLEKENKQDTYRKLLDVYSIVLCQEKFKDSPRLKEMMFQRITDLLKMGAKNDDFNGSQKIVNSYNPKCPVSKELMLLSSNLLEKEIDKLKKDSTISPATKTNILKMHDVFYSVHFPVIAEICSK